jgi:hypothetical protein
VVDRVVIEATPVTGSDKPAAGEAKPADVKPAEQSAGERPAWLPDNFKTPEELAASYKELQAQFTKSKQGEGTDKKPDGTEDKKPEEKTDAEKAADAADDKAKETADALKSKGVDVDSMSKRFWETGKVAEEDFAALEKAGIPRTAVQEFADAMVARSQARDAQLYNEVGGKENFANMATWAKQHYGDDKLAAYNASMESGNVGQMQQALVALKVAYEAANGKDPTTRVGGGSPPDGGLSVYRDVAEMQKDMNDPRYKTSDAFRKDVYEKIKRSKIM